MSQIREKSFVQAQNRTYTNPAMAQSQNFLSQQFLGQHTKRPDSTIFDVFAWFLGVA